MTGTTALLIDLENFYLGREAAWSRSHPEELYDFPIDLDALCGFAAEIAGERRITVRRAYANFNDRRPSTGDRPWDYYLQPLPRFVMEQGIEPIQVFRFPGGGNKNASDIRLALDATLLRGAPGGIDQFVLVTGDADFVPLVVELRRTGATVVVIGVAGSTNPIFQRYADRFELFEDLLAAREAKRGDDASLAPVRDALRNVLERGGPIAFAAVKPLVSAELGAPFDPTRFECDSTGDFLRKYANVLGLSLRRGEHDWEVGLHPPAGASSGAPALAAAATNGSGSEQHSTAFYRELLRQGMPRCYVVAYDDWLVITREMFRIANGPGEVRPRVMHQELVTDATDACADAGVLDAVRKVRDVGFQLFKAGCFELADDASPGGVVDFHWSRPAVLAPSVRTVADLREKGWTFLARLLRRRLEQRGSARPQAAALTELFCGAECDDEAAAILQGVLQEVDPTAAPAPA